MIFAKKWETTHDRINCRSKEIFSFEEPGGRPGKSFRSPADHPSTLPRYDSRVGGDRCTIGRVSEEIGEDSLSVS